MRRTMFETRTGLRFPSVSEDEMREVDRMATQDLQLGILQMMENAGRNLCLLVQRLYPSAEPVVILAGSGGNGGGGLCAARHLHNHGFQVDVLLSRNPASLGSAARTQLHILEHTGLNPLPLDNAESVIGQAELIIDALIGYSLRGAPSGEAARLITMTATSNAQVLALDLPSGMNATTGDSPGVQIDADVTLTLALPKQGLTKYAGTLYLGDIGIPSELYAPLGLHPPPFPSGDYIPQISCA